MANKIDLNMLTDFLTSQKDSDIVITNDLLNKIMDISKEYEMFHQQLALLVLTKHGIETLLIPKEAPEERIPTEDDEYIPAQSIDTP